VDLIVISEAIYTKIELLSKYRAHLKTVGDRKAASLSDYDKALALALIGLKNGKRYEIDGVGIENPPASIMEKIAKGICYKERLASEVADNEYKSLITYINCLQAEMNGLQSIIRYMDNA
jgi:hypothetical protein